MIFLSGSGIDPDRSWDRSSVFFSFFRAKLKLGLRAIGNGQLAIAETQRNQFTIKVAYGIHEVVGDEKHDDGKKKDAG